MTGEKFKEMIRLRVLELFEHLLRRAPTALEYNLFLHLNSDKIDRAYYNARREIDPLIQELILRIQNNENNSL